MIEFENVTFSYPDGQTLFKDLSLKFAQGTFSLVKGHSGTGKSSMLKLMNRLEEPQTGEIRFKGKPLQSYAPQVLRTSILYIQQIPIVINGSVKDNLLLPFDFKSNRDSEKPDDNQLVEFMDEFRLKNINLDHNATALSVGQLQRICLIRGLLLSPEVILLDEPTSALDEESCRIVESSVERLFHESGRTVIMVSHKKFEPEKITPVVLELVDGQIREVE
ncbi:MAG: ATP-binding cassette domain-containing protein [Deltaproteobacteria bacterium]|nr:ATP-binding cassette domain-containing protein [Deltaproteobacteria bacterium]